MWSPLSYSFRRTTIPLPCASGLYLFGFTYLYVGIANLAGLEPQGVGWWSLFVSGAAVIYAGLSFTVGNDPVFGVIWLGGRCSGCSSSSSWDSIGSS